MCEWVGYSIERHSPYLSHFWISHLNYTWHTSIIIVIIAIIIGDIFESGMEVKCKMKILCILCSNEHETFENDNYENIFHFYSEHTPREWNIFVCVRANFMPTLWYTYTCNNKKSAAEAEVARLFNDMVIFRDWCVCVLCKHVTSKLHVWYNFRWGKFLRNWLATRWYSRLFYLCSIYIIQDSDATFTSPLYFATSPTLDSLKII